MTDPLTGEAETPAQPPASAADRVRGLIRIRQYRHFTEQPPKADDLYAILEVARWTGSSSNSQPWRFILIRNLADIRRIAEAGLTQTRSLLTATAAIAIVLPENPARVTSLAYDDGRAAERILVAASILGLGAGIAWIRPEVLPIVATILGLPEDRMVRTIVSLGYPTPEARAPKSVPGTARLPREATVFEDRWPDDDRNTST